MIFGRYIIILQFLTIPTLAGTVKLCDKEQFYKEQIGVKEPVLMTNLPIYFIMIRNIWC